MIGLSDEFTSCFGAVPSGDPDHLRQVVRRAVRSGFAVLLIDPGPQKKPICTLTARQAKAEDRTVQEEARSAGDRHWSRRRHPCGRAHVLTDDKVADRVTRRALDKYGRVNVALLPAQSQMICVDVDTAAENKAFLDDWSAATGKDETGRSMTVQSPGQRIVHPDGTEEWPHKDGGHYWFTLPLGIQLPAEVGKLKADGGWVAMWDGCHVLVPPSAREEGPYKLVGPVEPAPEWLIRQIVSAAQERAERVRIRKEKLADGDDPIEVWAASVPWADLLDPDGWMEVGSPDNCGCPVWTAPGPHGSPKSATAHDLGCTKYDTDTGHGPLHVWTDNPPPFLNGHRTLNKLTYVALRDHDGSNVLAMAELGIPARGEDYVSADDLFAETAPAEEDEDSDHSEPAESGLLDGLAERLAGLPKAIRTKTVEQVVRRLAEKEADSWLAEQELDPALMSSSHRLLSALLSESDEQIPWRLEAP